MIIIMGFVAAFTGSALISYTGYFNTTPVNRCDVVKSLAILVLVQKTMKYISFKFS